MLMSLNITPMISDLLFYSFRALFIFID